MKKVYYLKTCSTCVRILKELDLPSDFELQDIKTNPITETQLEALKEIQRINSPELLTNNEAFHRMLTEGIKVTYQKDGNPRGNLVWLIDFENQSS